jgi:sugar phosphate isomerase/epimerase
MKLDPYVPTPESPFWGRRRSFDKTLELMSTCGYDGVEFLPDSLEVDLDSIAKKTREIGLETICFASGFIKTKYGLSISDSRDSTRRLARKKLNLCIDFASRLEADFVSIGLIRGKTNEEPNEAGMFNIIHSLQECGRYAQDRGVYLLIEPENRYETSYIHTVQEAIDTLRDVDHEYVKLMIDTYHMNIEEPNIENAVRAASEHLLHVHLADSNRRGPGMGHFEFEPFIKCLKDVGYNSFLGLEVEPEPDFDVTIRKGLSFIRNHGVP